MYTDALRTGLISNDLLTNDVKRSQNAEADASHRPKLWGLGQGRAAATCRYFGIRIHGDNADNTKLITLTSSSSSFSLIISWQAQPVHNIDSDAALNYYHLYTGSACKLSFNSYWLHLTVSAVLLLCTTALTVKCNQYELNDSLQAEPVYKWK